MTNSTSTILVPPPDRAGPGTREDIREVKPPVPIPSIWSWLGPLLIGLGVALVAWFLLRAWRRWRGRRSVTRAIMIPPHVRARERLRGALEFIGQPKPFCIAISQGLRVYLEEQFRLRAPERTTEEFLVELQNSPRLSRQQKLSLGDFLAQCDLVKFARHEPGEAALRELFDAAMKLVDETSAGPWDGTEVGVGSESAAAGVAR